MVKRPRILKLGSTLAMLTTLALASDSRVNSAFTIHGTHDITLSDFTGLDIRREKEGAYTVA
jgi:hypothetical protein